MRSYPILFEILIPARLQSYKRSSCIFISHRTKRKLLRGLKTVASVKQIDLLKILKTKISTQVEKKISLLDLRKQVKSEIPFMRKIYFLSEEELGFIFRRRKKLEIGNLHSSHPPLLHSSPQSSLSLARKALEVKVELISAIKYV